MLDRGQIVSHAEMCTNERYSLQAGMNYRPRGKSYSIVLMSQRKGARYPDRVVNEGRRILYVGHDTKRSQGGSDPRLADQAESSANGSLTENGKFAEAVKAFKASERGPEPVRVYEKIKDNIWTFNGLFALHDYDYVSDGIRYIFIFTLDLAGNAPLASSRSGQELSRVIPSAIKVEVWKRDRGACRMCGSTTDLHFDHDIPWSLGGSSLTADNIQLLCGRHNLEKSNKIQ